MEGQANNEVVPSIAGDSPTDNRLPNAPGRIPARPVHSFRRMSILPNTHPLAGAARRWLKALEGCVRAVDYGAARPLFAPDVLAFGTHARVVAGRDVLEREQWQIVWPAIREFAFRLEEACCVGNEFMLGVVVPWDSRGVTSDGTTFSRPGRATLVLVMREGRWVAIHSHFSLAPKAQ